MVAVTKLIYIEHITVKPDRICFDICFDPGAPTSTTPAIAERIVQQRPHLIHHTCVNSGGKTFGDVLAHTPIPHVLEHVAIDIAVAWAAEQGVHNTTTGTSEWVDKEHRHARIELSYYDDVQTMAAMKQALEEVCNVLDA